ncbi:MAG: tRNA (cytidine(34)-2'-O)-methyltransferase [Deltaproteobacteria bacterium]|nr:tRNA (cytidine(34)-2'-O)-methyltransferase [Deltaproteobacteria bacterium]
MFHVVLVEPEIPQNTGSIIRMCAATGCHLHLVGRLGFSLDDRHLRRAGLDYWRSVVVGVYPDLEALSARVDPTRWHLFSRRGSRRYDTVAFQDGDALVFGSESTGLPPGLLDSRPDRTVFLPVLGAVRSVNLSAAVHVAIYEAHRQKNFELFA